MSDSQPTKAAEATEEQPKAATEAKPTPQKTNKIEVRLQASGEAPIMKQRKYKVDADRRVQGIIQFIRRYLKMADNEGLFVYVNQAFSPSPDQTVNQLYQCYGSDGVLVLYYAKTQMWG